MVKLMEPWFEGKEIIFKNLYSILLDQRGEDAGAGDGEAGAGGGEGADPGNAGTGGAPAAGAGVVDGQGDAGQGLEAPGAAPKYGEFGDNPSIDDVFGAFSKLKSDFEGVKGKTTATERNLALTRKALEGSGIRAVQDEQGNIKLEVIKQPSTERKLRFNDEALGKLAVHFQGDKQAASGFADIVRAVIQDEVESWYEQREQSSMTQRQQIDSIKKEQGVINGRMIKMFPMLDPKFLDGKPSNPDFNQALYDKATEIWQEKYKGHPLKEFYAALDAAEELGITSAALQKAKVEGFEAGKTSKKILGPAGSGKAKVGVGGKLSQEDYFKLAPEERVKYDKEQLKIS